jgi:uncharacterized protein
MEQSYVEESHWIRIAQTYTQRFEMTATVQSNAELIKSGYDAFARGDIQGAFAVFAEDILWHVPGRGPLSRDYRGHAEVLGFFQHFMELSHGTFRIEVDDILAKGDRVVVLCTECAARRSKLVITAGPRLDDQGWASQHFLAVPRRSADGRRVLVDAGLARRE